MLNAYETTCTRHKRWVSSNRLPAPRSMTSNTQVCAKICKHAYTTKRVVKTKSMRLQAKQITSAASMPTDSLLLRHICVSAICMETCLCNHTHTPTNGHHAVLALCSIQCVQKHMEYRTHDYCKTHVCAQTSRYKDNICRHAHTQTPHGKSCRCNITEAPKYSKKNP